MGAPSAQVQSNQTSQPASKNAGQSASSEPGSGKGGQGGQMSSMSGQPQIGQPNTNGNTGLAPVNAGYGAGAETAYRNDMTTLTSARDASAPYSNTVGIDQQIGGSMNTTGQPIGKAGSGGNSASGGKA